MFTYHAFCTSRENKNLIDYQFVVTIHQIPCRLTCMQYQFDVNSIYFGISIRKVYNRIEMTIFLCLFFFFVLIDLTFSCKYDVKTNHACEQYNFCACLTISSQTNSSIRKYIKKMKKKKMCLNKEKQRKTIFKIHFVVDDTQL